MAAASTRSKIFSPRCPVDTACHRGPQVTIEVPVYLACNGNLVAKEAMRPFHTTADVARRLQVLLDLAEQPKLLFQGNFLRGIETVGELFNGQGEKRIIMVKNRPGIFATAGSDSKVKFWDCTSRQCVQTHEAHSNKVRSLSFSPDGQLLVSSSRDGSMLIWDIEQGAIVQTWNAPNSTDGAISVAFGPDSSKIIAGCGGGAAHVLSCTTGECLLSLTGHTSDVLAACMGPDERFAVTGSLDGTAIVWNLPSAEQRHCWHEHDGAVTSVSIGPSGSIVATSSNDTTARIWNLETGACERTLAGHLAAVVAASFGPVGFLLVTGSVDKTAKIWDWSSGLCCHTLASHAAGLRTVIFTPDGKSVATGANDGTVKVWDAKKGKQLHEWFAHQGRVCAMAAVYL